MPIVESGYHSSGKADPRENDSRLLFQARGVDDENATYRKVTLDRLNAQLSRIAWNLEGSNVLSMARGSPDYWVLLEEVPVSTLATARFFFRGTGIPVTPMVFDEFRKKWYRRSILRRFKGR